MILSQTSSGKKQLHPSCEGLLSSHSAKITFLPQLWSLLIPSVSSSHCFFPFHHPTISHCRFNKIIFSCFPSFTPPSLPVCETAAFKWWHSSHPPSTQLTVSLFNSSFCFLESALPCCRDGWLAKHGLTFTLITFLSIISCHPQYASSILLFQTSCLVPFLLNASACVSWNVAFSGG